MSSLCILLEILRPHEDSASISSAVVSTVGTVCDGSVGTVSDSSVGTDCDGSVGTMCDGVVNPASRVLTAGNLRITGPVPTGPEQTFSPASSVEFTADMIKKFEKRFENGYNIYTDHNYVEWLRIHHPDHLPTG